MIPLLAALTVGGKNPLWTLAGALAPPRAGEGWRGVQDVGAGRGMLRACLNRTHRRLPACLPLSSLVWVGRAKMEKKNAQVTHWPSQAGRAHPGGERGQAQTGRFFRDLASDSFC